MVPSQATTFARRLKKRLQAVQDREIVIVPPFTSLERIAGILRDTPIGLGAQNVHWETEGPFTGEISAPMLKDLPCSHVLLGHSERRQNFGETDEMISAKLSAVLSSEMFPILCIGETENERMDGWTFRVIEKQILGALKGLDKSVIGQVVVAYEPVWAIGTGNSAAPSQAQEVHERIRALIEKNWTKESAQRMRILYGGSVTPENVRELMEEEDIDGVLVGGASLSIESFESIVRFEEKSQC
jgi:triosephosphate isomerase